MSSQIDLGLRLFLIDGATGGLFSFNGVLNLIGATFGELSSRGNSLASTFDSLFERTVKNDVAIAGLNAANTELSNAFAQGGISLGDYTAKVAENDAKIAALNEENQMLTYSMQNAEAEMANVSTALAGVSVAAGAAVDLLAFGSALHYVTDNGAELQDAMAKVRIAVEGTDQHFEQMQEYLVKLANNSVYSSAEVADGFQIMGERGYTAAQILQGNMGAALTNLSEAIGSKGSSGVVGAAGLLSTAMELWHAQFSDSAHYADLLTYAFYHGIPSVDQLRSALEAVGGRAQLLGVPLDQVVVALDALGRAGMQGSQAGASLNYMLTALSSPIPKAQSELTQLGLLVVNNVSPAFKQFAANLDIAAKKAGDTVPKFDGSVKSLDDMFKEAQKVGTVSKDATFYQWAVSIGILNSKLYDAKGRFIGLTPALQLIADKLKGMNPEQQAAALSGLFNVKSGQGATQLINNLGSVKTNTDALKKSQDAHGLAQKDAADITSTYNARLTELQTTLAHIGATIGMPIVTALANFFGQINTGISTFTQANPAFASFMTQFILIGAVLSVVGIIVGLVVAAVAFLTPEVLAFVGIALLVAAAIPLVSAAIAGLTMWLNKMGVIQAVAGFFGVLGNYLGKIFGPMLAELGKNVQQAGGLLADLGSTIMHSLGQLGHALQPVLPVLAAVGIAIGILVGASLALLGGIFMGLLRGLVYGLTALLSGAIMVVSGIIRIFTGFVQIIMGIFTIIAGIFVGLFTGNWGLLQQGLHKVVDGILNIFKGMGQILIGLVIGIFGTIIAFAWGFIQGFIGFFMHLFDVLVGHSIIPDMMHAILHWFQQMGSWVIGSIIGLVSGVIGWISHMGQLIGTTIQVYLMFALVMFESWGFKTLSFFKNLPGQIISALGNLGTMLYNSGMNAMKMLGSGIQNAIGFVTGPVGNVASSIGHMLGFHSPPREGPLSDSDQYMPNMMKMYAAGIYAHTPLLQSAVHGAASVLLPRSFTSPTVQSLQNSSSAALVASQANGGNTTVNLNMDGTPITTVVVNRLTGQLMMNGSSRMLR